jgi:hypothetical protein
LEGRTSAVRRWAQSSYALSLPWPHMSHRCRRVGHFVIIGATSSCVSLASLACRSVLLCLSSSSPPSPHALHRLTSCPSSPSPCTLRRRCHAPLIAFALLPRRSRPSPLVAVALVPSSPAPWSPRPIAPRRLWPVRLPSNTHASTCSILDPVEPQSAVHNGDISMPPHSNLLPMFSSVDSNPHSESTRDLGSATTSTATSTSTYGGGLPGSFGEHPI